ncbi:MAG: radical SAM protein [Pseudomonadota bacterium]
MKSASATIVLIGYQDQGNLGLGYIAAVLMKHGYHVHLIDFKEGERAIFDKVNLYKPLIVGFSLIFQYFLPRFSSLASYLRSRGIKSHFTAGGHYPSLRYEEIMQQIPELDSVALFEGEHTLLELAESLSKEENWQNIQSIAYRENKRVKLNPLRPLVSDLDQLPFPYRPFNDNKILGRKIYPILATRGCPRNCSFCSIREFYGKAPGKLVRRRSPYNVVMEMKELYEEENASIFLFQDDDFPLLGKPGRRWVYDFIRELEKHDLINKLIWKISCRVDEVEKDLFSDMREAGLYLVYLGIESGTDTGLKLLNKQVTVDDNRSAVATLKELNLMFGYGFMLFDPSSTFETLSANIKFLRDIIGDGSAPLVFCKMLPYAGTPIEKELIDSGRLTGSIAQPDYNYVNSNLDEYYKKLSAALEGWTHGTDAISPTLNLLLHELSVIKNQLPILVSTPEYEGYLRKMTRDTNEIVFHLIEMSSNAFKYNNTFPYSTEDLNKEAKNIVKELVERRDRYILQNQTIIMEDINKIAC